MTGDGIRHAAERISDNKVATAAWRFFGGLALTMVMALSGFTLDAVYEAHAQIAAQSVQIQLLSGQLDKLSGVIASGRTESDAQALLLSSKIEALEQKVAVHDQSIAEIRSHIGQQDQRLVSIWDDVATLRGAIKR